MVLVVTSEMDDVVPSIDCTLRLDVQSHVVVLVGSNSFPLFTMLDLTDGVCSDGS